MTPADLSRLLLLSAIWGASFLFMRIGAPVLGPARLIFLRVGLAALFLLAIAFYLRKPLAVRRYWKHYLVLGCCNSALPFLLFAYAAQTVSASLLAILNATAPLWALAVGTFWFKSRPAPGAMFGMLLGIVGVALVAGVETLALPAGGGLAVVAALGAAASYGVASTYTKTAPAVEPLANAHGSMWAATAMLLPLALLAPPLAATPASPVLFSVAALGIVCSGVAYLLYFRLVSDIGAAPALTVTFLIPVFGIFWGVVFLNESVGWHTFAGSLAILAGTVLVTGFSPATLRAKKG